MTPPASLYQHIGHRIHHARTARHWTQAQLAETIGLSASAIYLYERGVRRIHIDTLLLVAKALDVPVAYFFTNPPQRTKTLTWP